MTTAAAVSLALITIGVVSGSLAAAIVLGRTSRRLRLTRREQMTSRVRPLLIAMLGEEDDDAARQLLGQLLAMDRSTWRALEPTVAGLLGKLRGTAHDLLRSLLESQGSVDRARRRLRRFGAVGRARAAELLGSLEDPGVTADLVSRLGDRDAEVRQVVARALGRSGDPAGAAPLLACLAGGSVPPRVVSQALLRLGPGAEPALVAALQDTDELIRAVAVEILGLSSAVGAFGALRRSLLTDPSLEVRIRAARSLGQVGMPAARRALQDATKAQQPDPLRAVAARALGELGHPGAVPRLRVLLRDPVHRVASNAGRALAGLGPRGTAALQREILVRPGGPSAAHALDALSRGLLGFQLGPESPAPEPPAPEPVAPDPVAREPAPTPRAGRARAGGAGRGGYSRPTRVRSGAAAATAAEARPVVAVS